MPGLNTRLQKPSPTTPDSTGRPSALLSGATRPVPSYVILSPVSVKVLTIPSAWTTTCCLQFPDREQLEFLDYSQRSLFRFHWTQCCRWVNHYSYLQCGRWYWLVRSSAYGTVCQCLRRSGAWDLRNAWAWVACPGRFPKALIFALKTITQVNATSYGGLRLF